MTGITIYLKIKALAQRRPLIEHAAYLIKEPVATSNELIEVIVRRNVDDYNSRTVDAPLFPYLTENGLEDAAVMGKIGFDDRKNEKKQNADDAVANALTCFRDGIFKLFANDTELGIDEPVQLKDGDEITFIRLTMLAGRLW